jgi:2-methylcitrate dehydratase PrpD
VTSCTAGNDERAEALEEAGLSRRGVLKVAGSSVALAALAACDRSAEAQSQAARAESAMATAPAAARGARQPDLTGRLARYMAGAPESALPPGVVLAAKHRILDTLGAIVSGAKLKPGEVAADYVRAQGGTPEACVAATNLLTSAVNAALANGMSAHADETDDFHPHTKAHPGCAVVPAALAMGERQGSSGTELLRAVVLGYDVCCRFLMALGPDLVRASQRSAEGFSSTIGATAAASAIARFDETRMRYALSYAAQQTSGVWSWQRDEEHIEKAFDFSGMGARNGAAAATMIQGGFTGVLDALEGPHNVIDAFSTAPQPEEMVADLGMRFYVEETAIKTFPVGYPIQSPLAAFFALRERHNLTASDVEHILVRLPADGARIVDNRAMPDVNCQHLMALAVIDGEINFANSHSYERMSDPQVLAMKDRIELIADQALVVIEAPRSGFVEVTTRDGSRVSLFVPHAPGTPENPLDTEGVNAKVRSLMAPILGQQRTETLIARIDAIEEMADVRELRALLSA